MSLDSYEFRIFFTCSRVPEEYVPQHPTNANPPTLFLALSGICLCSFSISPFSALPFVVITISVSFKKKSFYFKKKATYMFPPLSSS